MTSPLSYVIVYTIILWSLYLKLFKKQEPVISTEENPIDYKYQEDRILKELVEYIDNTYDQHYSQNKYQATEFILDSGHGNGFCIGNILKYAQDMVKGN